MTQRLRALRRDLAKTRDLAPHRIFPDRTLRLIARARPRTLQDLARVPSVGPMTLADFGAEILAAVAAPPS